MIAGLSLNAYEEQIILEYHRRGLHLKDKRRSYRAEGFDAQNNYLDDRWVNRYRTALCTRRAGKSVGEAIDDLEIGSQFPNSRMVYGSLTVESTWDILYDPIMEMDEEFKIGVKPNNSKHKFLLPNGSTIKIFGLDASYKQMKKILGSKLRKATVDESGSISIGLEKIVKQVVKPALADLRPMSWLSLIGTPENIPNTYFQKVTEGKDIDLPWSNHKWTAYDNPFIKRQWKEEIDELIHHNPNVVNASWFKTHYLGEWCVDDELIIIHYDASRNYVPELPDLGNQQWSYVLGVDLGFNDASSFAVLAYNQYHKVCYLVEAFKEVEMDFTDVANTIRALQRRYNISTIIVDGANKQGVAEVQNRHRIPLNPAEKSDKATYLRLMDDDFKQGEVKVTGNKSGEWVTEAEALIWKDSNRQEEDPRCQNHLNDAVLYAWRHCLHYLDRNLPKKHPKNSQEYQEQWEKELAERCRKKDQLMRELGIETPGLKLLNGQKTELSRMSSNFVRMEAYRILKLAA